MGRTGRGRRAVRVAPLNIRIRPLRASRRTSMGQTLATLDTRVYFYN